MRVQETREEQERAQKAPEEADAGPMGHMQPPLRKRRPRRNQCSFQDGQPRSCQRIPRCSSPISHPSFANTSARSELDERGSTAKKTYGGGAASPSQEGNSIGTLPKATNLDAEDKRGVRKEV